MLKRFLGCLWLLLLIAAVLLEVICIPIRLLVYLGIAIYRKIKYKKSLYTTINLLFIDLVEAMKYYYPLIIKIIKWFFEDEEIDIWE